MTSDELKKSSACLNENGDIISYTLYDSNSNSKKVIEKEDINVWAKGSFLLNLQNILNNKGVI